MFEHLDIHSSIEWQRERIAHRYRAAISKITKMKGDRDKLFKLLVRNQWENLRKARGMDTLLATHYIFEGDFETAWILCNYLCLIRTILPMDLQEELNELLRRELEDTNYRGMPAFNLRHPAGSVRQTLDFGIGIDMEDADFSRQVIEYYCTPPEELTKDYDIEPSARYVTFAETKEYYVSYDSVGVACALLEIYMKLEQYDRAAEMLFRIQQTISVGEPPKYLTEGPRLRHYAARMHMYDCWIQARFCNDKKRRKALAWTALSWHLESGLRSVGTYIHCELYRFTDFCQIIGEFGLWEEKQTEFLRHFKKFAMHASKSLYKKMVKDPIKPIPFKDRGLPTREEYKAMFDEYHKAWVEKDRAKNPYRYELPK